MFIVVVVAEHAPLALSALSTIQASASNGRMWPASARSPGDFVQTFSLLSHLERIVDFNTEVARSALRPIDCGQ
ncbi:hypothetical protein [Trinickia sp.]|uniref:hypothetical protein n=1 Tax=Trinickia sp. TaxID=2571163 RepID=UPI003F7EDD0C